MDEAFNAVGEFGPFQKKLMICVFLSLLYVTAYSSFFPYLTKIPNISLTILSNNTIIDTEYNEKYCDSKLYNITPTLKNSLENWSYKFNFTCKNIKYISYISLAYFCAATFGNWAFSSIPDKYGRKTIFIILMILSCFCYINLYFSINGIHLVFTHILGGLSAFILGMCFYVLQEFMPKDKSDSIIGIANSFYPLSGMIFSIYFFLFNNWKYLFLFLMITHIIITILIYNIFQESPRWLNACGKKQEALNVFKYIAEQNNRLKEWEEFLNKNNDKFLNNKENSNNENENNNNENNHTFFEVMSYKSQRNKILLHAYIWFAFSYCFFGIILNLGNMKGNFFSNSFFAFLGEMISEVASGYVAQYCGRVQPMKISFFAGSIFMILKYFVNDFFSAICLSIGMFSYAMGSSIISIYSSESFPTVIRGLVCSYFLIVDKVAPIPVVPLSLLVGTDIVNLIFIIIGIIGGVSCYYIEETLGKKLEDEIPELMDKEKLLARLDDRCNE